MTAGIALNCGATWHCVTLYVYGFSMSFNDSTVYFTDIMQLDSAWTDTKTKFVYERDVYASQLKNYMTEQGEKTPTCIMMYSEKRNKVEKQYVKLKNRFSKRGAAFVVKYIPASDFAFSPVSAAEELAASQRMTKEEREAAKAAEKEAAKAKKGARGGGPGHGPGGGPGGENGRPSGPPPGGPGGGM